MTTPAASKKSFANPFPGLRSYEIQETDLFFGRDDQRFELLDRLRRFRFLAVVGQSGCGKSSLVKAGVLASLRDGFMAESPDSWRIAVMRPGNDPLGHLAASLAQGDVLAGADEESGVAHQRILTQLRLSSKGILRALDYADLPEDGRLLVLVDQFEEIFRYLEEAETRKDASDSNGHAQSVDWAETDTVDDFDVNEPAPVVEAPLAEEAKDDARAFVRLLLDAAADDERRVYVLLTLRSSFLGNCTQFPELPEAINQGLYLVPRLNRDQLREAIVLPVEKTAGKGTISNRLVNRLLNDLGDDPDQLPILQHALMRMWQVWHFEGRRGPLDLEHYERTGRLEQSLEIHLNEIYLAMDERHQLVAEQVFRNLTQVLDEDRLVRRPTRLRVILDQIQTTWQRDGAGESQTALGGDLEDEVRFVIDQFRAPGNSFLMPPASEMLLDPTVIDISHESLIRQWPKLREWTLDEHRSRKTLATIADKSQSWHRSGRGLDRLLFGVELAEAEELWKGRPGLLTSDQSQYLSASLTERGREAKVRLRSWFFLTLALVLGVGVLIGIWLTVQANRARGKAEVATLEAEKATDDAMRATADANAKKLELDKNLTQRRMSEGARFLAPTASEMDPSRALVWFAKAYPRSGETVDDLLRVQLASTLRHGPRLSGLLPTHSSPIVDAAMANGHQVVFVRKDGTAWLWDLASNSLEPLRDQEGHEDDSAPNQEGALNAREGNRQVLGINVGVQEDGSEAIVVFETREVVGVGGVPGVSTAFSEEVAAVGSYPDSVREVRCRLRKYPLHKKVLDERNSQESQQSPRPKTVDLGPVDLGRDGPLVAIDPWGGRVATKSGGTIRVWDVERGAIIASNGQSAAPTQAAEPSKASQSEPKIADPLQSDPHERQRDGRETPGDVGNLAPSEIGGASPLATKEDSANARLIALDASGSLLAIAFDEKVALYSIAEGVVSKTKEQDVKAATQLITSDAPNEIAVLTDQKIFRLTAAAATDSFNPTANDSITTMHAIVRAALGAGMNRVLAEQQAGSVLLFDQLNWITEMKAQFRHSSHTSFLGFSMGDRRILLGYEDGSATVWALDGARIRTPGITDVFAQCTQPLLLTPDGKVLACTMDGNGVLRCWDVIAAECQSQFEHPQKLASLDDRVPADPSAWRLPFWQTKYLVDSAAKRALVGKEDSRVAQIVDLVTKKPIAEIAHSRPIERATYSSAAGVWATVAGREIQLCRAADGKKLWETVNEPLGRDGERLSAAERDCRWKIRSIQFDPRGQRLLVLDSSHQLVVWDVATGKQKGTISSQGPIDFATPLSENVILVVHSDVAKAVDASDSSRKYLFRHRRPIRHACASPDQKFLATADDEGTVSIRQRDDERAIVEWNAGAPVSLCRYSEDGRILVTVAGEEVRLWDANQGRPITPSLKHPAGVQDVRLPEGNRHLVTIAGGHPWVWDLALQDEELEELDALAALTSEEKLDELDRIVALPKSDLDQYRTAWSDRIRSRAVPPFDETAQAISQLANWVSRPGDAADRRLRPCLVSIDRSGNPALGDVDAYLLAMSTEAPAKTIVDYITSSRDALAARPYSRIWLLQKVVRHALGTRPASSAPSDVYSPIDAPAPDVAAPTPTMREEIVQALRLDLSAIHHELDAAIEAQPRNLAARFLRACMADPDPKFLDQRKEDLLVILATHPRYAGPIQEGSPPTSFSMRRLAKEIVDASDTRDGQGALAQELDVRLNESGRRQWWVEEIQQSRDRDWLDFVYRVLGKPIDESTGRSSFLLAFLADDCPSDMLRWGVERVGELGSEGDAVGARLRELLADQPWRKEVFAYGNYDLPELVLNSLANVWKERHPDELTVVLEEALRDNVDGLGLAAARRLSDVSGANAEVLSSAVGALVRCLNNSDLTQDERAVASKATLATLLAAERNNPTNPSRSVENGLKRAAVCESTPFADHAAAILTDAAVVFSDEDKLAFIGKFPTEAGIDRVSELASSPREKAVVLLELLGKEQTTLQAAAACEIVDVSGANADSKAVDALRRLVRAYLPEELRAKVLARYWQVASAAEAFELAKELLASSDMGNRQEGARKLGDLGEAAVPAVAALEAALQDRSAEVQSEAARALVRITAGRPGFDAFWNTISQHPNSDVRAAALREFVSRQLTDEDLVLIERLKADPAESVQISVLQALAATHRDKQQRIDALRGLLAMKSDAAIRKDAAMRLGEYGYDAAGVLGDVLEACKDSDETVQAEAVLAVVKIAWHSEQDVQKVKATVYDYPPNVQKLLAEKISSYGSGVPLYTPLLIDLLGPTRENNVQEWAAYALARIGPAASAAEDRILEAANDENVIVRVEASRALWNIFKEKHQDLAFKTLHAELKSETNFARQLAAEIIGTMGAVARPAVQDLLPLMTDTTLNVRTATAKSLGLIGDGSSAVVAALVLGLKDADKSVRDESEKSLKSVASDLGESRSDVVSLLDNPTTMVHAARLLWYFDANADLVLPHLADALSSEETTDRLAIVVALTEMGPAAQSVVSEITRFVDPTSQDVALQEAIASSLGKIGGDDAQAALADMVARFRGRPQIVAAEAMLVLRQLSPAGLDVLTSALVGQDENLTLRAVQALAEAGDNQAAGAVSALLVSMKHANASIREWSVDALGKRGQSAKEAIPALVGALDDTASNVRQWAAYALQMLATKDDPSVAEKLVAKLTDDVANVRKEVARALGAMALPLATPALVTALDDSDSTVREAAAQAIGRLPDVDDTALTKLETLLDDPSAGVVYEAANSLVRLAPERLRTQLEDRLTKGTGVAATWREWLAASHMAQGQWTEALSVCDTALQEQYLPYSQRRRLYTGKALAQLCAGDKDAYAATCRQMIEEFPDPQFVRVDSFWLPWGPIPPELARQALPLAQAAASWRFRDPATLSQAAGVYHRSGNTAHAAELLEKSIRLRFRRDISTVRDELLLALVRHSMGRDDLARESLDLAQGWIRENLDGKTDLASISTRPRKVSWEDYIPISLLHSELQAALQSADAPAPP